MTWEEDQKEQDILRGEPRIKMDWDQKEDEWRGRSSRTRWIEGKIRMSYINWEEDQEEPDELIERSSSKRIEKIWRSMGYIENEVKDKMDWEY